MKRRGFLSAIIGCLAIPGMRSRRLEAVGIDVDGQIKPIDELTFRSKKWFGKMVVPTGQTVFISNIRVDEVEVSDGGILIVGDGVSVDRMTIHRGARVVPQDPDNSNHPFVLCQ